MDKLFKKAAVFTDIHFGLKSNSQLHNEGCLNFVIWATAEAKKQGCDVALFLGDWHNNRASINIVTLNYSLRALEHLNDNFGAVYFIIDEILNLLGQFLMNSGQYLAHKFCLFQI